MVRVAIIGYGIMGSKYAAMIRSGEIINMKLTLVCIRSRQKLDSVRESLDDSSVHVAVGDDELLERMDMFDAMIITTPHSSHLEYALMGTRHGKHILVEKPAGITANEARIISDAADEANITYQVMFHKRTVPYVNKLKALIDEGVFGKIIRVSAEATFYRTKHYHNQAMWRSTWSGEYGGMLINQGQHVLDTIFYLFGMPIGVDANISFGKLNDFSVDDEANILYSYEGFDVALFMSTVEMVPTERIKIVGSKATAIYEAGKITLSKYPDSIEYALTSTSNDASKVEYNTCTIEAPGKTGMEYQTMLSNFDSSIESGTPLICPGHDAIAAIEMCNSAYLSGYHKKEITLPCDPEEYDTFLKTMIDKERSNL